MNTPQDQISSRPGQGQQTGQGQPERQAEPRGQAQGQGQQTFDETARDLKDKVGELATEATTEGKARVGEYREVAATRVDRLAQSVKAAASELEGEDTGNMSRHIADLASGMQKLSQSLREKSGDELLRDVNGMARSNPGLFLAAGVVVGFGLTRLLRASAVGSGEGGTDDTFGSSEASGSGGSGGRGGAETAGVADPYASGMAGGQSGVSSTPGLHADPSRQGATSASGASSSSTPEAGGSMGGAGAATRGNTISGTGLSGESHGGLGLTTARDAGSGAAGTYGAAGSFARTGSDGFETAAGSGGVAKPGGPSPDDAIDGLAGDESNGRRPL